MKLGLDDGKQTQQNVTVCVCVNYYFLEVLHQVFKVIKQIAVEASCN